VLYELLGLVCSACRAINLDSPMLDHPEFMALEKFATEAAKYRGGYWTERRQMQIERDAFALVEQITRENASALNGTWPMGVFRALAAESYKMGRDEKLEKLNRAQAGPSIQGTQATRSGVDSTSR
jgi:hypothetical protein